jgi:hypothetical protein
MAGATIRASAQLRIGSILFCLAIPELQPLLHVDSVS